MTSEELERAVERLEKALKIADQYATGVHFGEGNDGFVSFADLRLLLSERAELLATVERMRDKVEGLDSDLRCAVQVAYLRGATEWAKRNYPGMIEWLESCVTAHAALTTGEATNAGENGNGRLMP